MAAPHFWLSEAQCARLQPLLSTKGRGVPRVADRRVLSGLIPGIRNGLRGRAAPACSGPPKTRSNRFGRWRQASIFNQVFAALANAGGAPAPVLGAAPHLQAPRPAASLLTKGRFRAAWGAPGADATRNSLPAGTALATP